MKKIFLFLMGVFTLFTFNFSIVSAIDLDNGINSSGIIGEGASKTNVIAEKTGMTTTNLPKLFNQSLTVILGFSTLVSVLFVIYGGFLWATSQGDSKKTGQAKKYFTVGFISVSIILSAYAVSAFVFNQIDRVVYKDDSTGGNYTPPPSDAGDGGCTSDGACGIGKYCNIQDGQPSGFCSNGCKNNSNCGASENCNIPSGQTIGTCAGGCDSVMDISVMTEDSSKLLSIIESNQYKYIDEIKTYFDDNADRICTGSGVASNITISSDYITFICKCLNGNSSNARIYSVPVKGILGYPCKSDGNCFYENSNEGLVCLSGKCQRCTSVKADFQNIIDNAIVNNNLDTIIKIQNFIDNNNSLICNNNGDTQSIVPIGSSGINFKCVCTNNGYAIPPYTAYVVSGVKNSPCNGGSCFFPSLSCVGSGDSATCQ